MNNVHYVVSKFSKKTEKLTREYEINFPIKECSHLFDVEDDVNMHGASYEITSPEQIKFFRDKGIPVTKRSFWYIDSYLGYVDSYLE